MALESLIVPRSLAPPEFKERSLDLHNGFLLVTNSFERCLLTTREVALHSCGLSARRVWTTPRRLSGCGPSEVRLLGDDNLRDPEYRFLGFVCVMLVSAHHSEKRHWMLL